MSRPGQRFTIDGDAALEARLTDFCDRVIADGLRAIVPADVLEAVVLAGGYGRGEGGVLRTPQGDAPYNDLEFFVLIKGPVIMSDRQYGPAIHALGHRLSEDIGIEVEFKVLSLEKLQRSAVNMFYYDLVSGHRIVAGPEDVLKSCSHHRDASAIPLHEAARLLMNRCSGLLYARQRLEQGEFSAEDADFVGRNIAKAQLALGDVVLAANGRYHWSCLERGDRLTTVKELALPLIPLREAHRAGVEFKLHPVRTTAGHGELVERHAAISRLAWAVWQWLETKRLGVAVSTPPGYAGLRNNKCPESPALKNLLVRVRAFGPASVLSPQRFRYPREALFNTLPLLLWESRQEIDTGFVAAQLRAPVATWPDAVKAYEALWCRFN